MTRARAAAIVHRILWLLVVLLVGATVVALLVAVSQWSGPL